MSGVLAIHTIAWGGHTAPQAERWFTALDWLARLAVPLFVILTGVVLAMSTKRSGQTRLQFMRKRLARVGVPWLIWAAIWVVAWLVIPTLFDGQPPLTPGDFAGNILAGPGYLYFLLIILQLSVLFSLFPTTRIAQRAVILAGIALHVAFTTGRLLLPADAPDAVWNVAIEHGYELFPGWIGFFAIGVYLAGEGKEWLKATPLRVLLCATLTFATIAVLLAWGQVGGDPNRLWSANLFLHPLFLPACSGLFMLVYWAADALLWAVPQFGRTAIKLGELSFGIYLVHQFPMEGFGKLLQGRFGGISLSDELPRSLPEIALLFALTCASSLVMVAVMRRYSWGRLALGEQPNPGRRQTPSLPR